MGRILGVIALALSWALIAGCGSTRLFVTSTHSSPPSVDPGHYIAQMGAEQAQLAVAEKRIPQHPRTPAALSRSLAMLADAISQLASGLAGVRPPPSVAAEHARLVSIVRAYAAQLSQAARIAAQPAGSQNAEAVLISATDSTSAAFTQTVGKIDTTLQR